MEPLEFLHVVKGKALAECVNPEELRGIVAAGRQKVVGGLFVCSEECYAQIVLGLDVWHSIFAMVHEVEIKKGGGIPLNFCLSYRQFGPSICIGLPHCRSLGSLTALHLTEITLHCLSVSPGSVYRSEVVNIKVRKEYKAVKTSFCNATGERVYSGGACAGRVNS